MIKQDAITLLTALWEDERRLQENYMRRKMPANVKYHQQRMDALEIGILAIKRVARLAQQPKGE